MRAAMRAISACCEKSRVRDAGRECAGTLVSSRPSCLTSHDFGFERATRTVHGEKTVCGCPARRGGV